MRSLGELGRRWGRWRLLPGLLAALLGVAVFAPTLGHGLVYDDAFILRSPLLGRPFDLAGILGGSFYAPGEDYLGLFRPVGQWSLLLDAELARVLCGSPAHPFVFHLVNVLLHGAVTLLLFAWLERLGIGRAPAVAAAVLWTVHPIHVEAVANVTGRYEPLAAGLGLSFLLLHRARRPIAAAACLLLALGCKESALAFVPLAWLADALFGERRPLARWPGHALAAAVALGWLCVRASALSGKEIARPYLENPLLWSPPGERLLTAARVQLRVLRDQLAPLWLAPDHSFADITPASDVLDPAVAGFLALVAAALVAAWLARRAAPVVTLAIAGYALLFAPTSNFLVPIGTLQADRLAYMPSACVCLLLAAAVLRLPRRGAVPALVAATGVLACLTLSQSRVWKDDLTLYAEQVRAAPQSAKARINLGKALGESGRPREALEAYRAARAIYPYSPEPHLGLALILSRLDEDPAAALEAWTNSIRYATRGERPELQALLRAVDAGRFDEVRAIRERLLAADPHDRFLPRIAGLLAAHERAVRGRR